MNWMLVLNLFSVIAAIAAAIAAWFPFLYNRFIRVKIKGKLISKYGNLGTFKGEPKALFLFKLSVISLNQSFDLFDIDIDIKFEKNGWTHNTAINQRETFFTFEDNKKRRLNVPVIAFLNNLSILKKDEPAVGYLMTNSTLFKDDKIIETRFIFKSFDGKTKSLSFKEKAINESKLLFDDSIWIII